MEIFWPKHDFGPNLPANFGPNLPARLGFHEFFAQLHKIWQCERKFLPKFGSAIFSKIATRARISFGRARLCTSSVPIEWYRAGLPDRPGWGDKSILNFGFQRRAEETPNLNRCFLPNGSEFGHAFTAPNRRKPVKVYQPAGSLS